MSGDIHLLSLVELADAIAARALSAVEVMRATVARAERLQPELNCFISLQADAALEERGGGRRGARARRGAGAAARRPARPQGHVLPHGPRHHLRLAHPQGLRGGPRQHRPRPSPRGRRDLPRRAQHGGVRHRADRPQRALGRLPQPVEPGAHLRRLVERLRRRGRGPRGLRRPRLGYRRLGAPAVGLQRRGRAQAHQRAGQPPRAHAALAHAGHGGPPRPHRARRGQAHPYHRRPRPARPHQQQAPRARLRGGAGRGRRSGLRIGVPTSYFYDIAERRGARARGAEPGRVPRRRRHGGRGFGAGHRAHQPPLQRGPLQRGGSHPRALAEAPGPRTTRSRCAAATSPACTCRR